MVLQDHPLHKLYCQHTVQMVSQLSSVTCFKSDATPWEFMPNGAPPGSVTAHESKPECCMIEPLQGHDLLSYLKLLLTVLQALPPSGLGGHYRLVLSAGALWSHQ